MLNKGIRSDLSNDAPIYSFSDEATKKKIKRHLMDINDIITDTDIKNAKVPGAENKTKSSRSQKSKQIKTGHTETPIEETPGKPSSPWDIIKE